MSRATELLDQLDAYERKQIWNHLLAENGGQIDNRASRRRQMPFSREEVELWIALELASGRRRLRHESEAALGNWCSTHGRDRFRSFASDVESYISDSCGALMRRSVRDEVRRQIIDCLGKMMREWENIPVAPNSLINCIDYLPSAVEQNFPGYADAGMLHKVARLAA